jgi:hypothetical protein
VKSHNGTANKRKGLQVSCNGGSNQNPPELNIVRTLVMLRQGFWQNANKTCFPFKNASGELPMDEYAASDICVAV